MHCAYAAADFDRHRAGICLDDARTSDVDGMSDDERKERRGQTSRRNKTEAFPIMEGDDISVSQGFSSSCSQFTRLVSLATGLRAVESSVRSSFPLSPLCCSKSLKTVLLERHTFFSTTCISSSSDRPLVIGLVTRAALPAIFGPLDHSGRFSQVAGSAI